ncbi:MAG: DUF86 domain-containing protein [Alicyclobacillus sp.]|nr:DUF86 domain-containing protein [Alicyclobacillus sp.]
MFVTDELRAKVNVYLSTLDERASWLMAQSSDDTDWSADFTRRLAAERAFHVAVECVTDAASLVIDALVMRDPANYLDIVKVLWEESVITRAWYEEFAQAVDIRNRLVRDYCAVSAGEIRDAVVRFAPLFADYVKALRAYLGIQA